MKLSDEAAPRAPHICNKAAQIGGMNHLIAPLKPCCYIIEWNGIDVVDCFDDRVSGLHTLEGSAICK